MPTKLHGLVDWSRDHFRGLCVIFAAVEIVGRDDKSVGNLARACGTVGAARKSSNFKVQCVSRGSDLNELDQLQCVSAHRNREKSKTS